MTGILLADHLVCMRQALALLLERERFRVIAEAADGLDAVRLAHRCHMDLALLAMHLPKMNGWEAAKQIRRAAPRTRIMLLADQEEGPQMVFGFNGFPLAEGLRTGIHGLVFRNQLAEDLVRAIHSVLGGAIYIAPGASQQILSRSRGTTISARERLSPRGRQVLQLVAEGKTTKEVAALLGISVKTADYHRTKLMQRLGVHDTASLVRYAIRLGVVPL